MPTPPPLTRLIKILSACQAIVSYTPLNNEVDLGTLSINDFIPAKQISLPTDQNSDPFAWAEKCINRFDGLNVCVFIPGKLFDKTGTRHGRGGGWYDRFLSKIPKHWIRIGIATKKTFSGRALKRQVWDEPVDWVIITENNIVSAIKAQNFDK